jgi:hypothetical protein
MLGCQIWRRFKFMDIELLTPVDQQTTVVKRGHWNDMEEVKELKFQTKIR